MDSGLYLLSSHMMNIAKNSIQRDVEVNSMFLVKTCANPPNIAEFTTSKCVNINPATFSVTAITAYIIAKKILTTAPSI